MALDIGRIAFMAYAKQVNNISHDGKILPLWENLGKVAQDGWRHSACAVLEYIDKCRENLNEEVYE